MITMICLLMRLKHFETTLSRCLILPPAISCSETIPAEKWQRWKHRI